MFDWNGTPSIPHWCVVMRCWVVFLSSARFFAAEHLPLRNKHPSRTPQANCFGVRVVYNLELLLLLLESVHSRMFCANCVSAIMFNIHTNALTKRTSKHTETRTYTEHHTTTIAEALPILKFFFCKKIMCICAWQSTSLYVLCECAYVQIRTRGRERRRCWWCA